MILKQIQFGANNAAVNTGVITYERKQRLW
jgi:hypothetical protein